MSGVAFKNLDDCQREIDRVFRENPNSFEVTANKVEAFLKPYTLERCLREGCLDQVADLRNNLSRCKVQLKMQEFQRSLKLGSKISGQDVLECLIVITEYSSDQKLPNEVTKLYDIAQRAKAFVNYGFSSLDYQKEFLRLVEVTYSVDLETPAIIRFFKEAFPSLFSSTTKTPSSKPSYSIPTPCSTYTQPMVRLTYDPVSHNGRPPTGWTWT